MKSATVILFLFDFKILIRQFVREETGLIVLKFALPETHVVQRFLFYPHAVIVIAVISSVPGFSQHVVLLEIAIHNIRVNGVFVSVVSFLTSFLKVDVHEGLGLAADGVLEGMFFKLIVGEGVDLVSGEGRRVELSDLELSGFEFGLFVVAGVLRLVFLLDDKIAIRKHAFVVKNYLYNMISATNIEYIICGSRNKIKRRNIFFSPFFSPLSSPASSPPPRGCPTSTLSSAASLPPNSTSISVSKLSTPASVSVHRGVQRFCSSSFQCLRPRNPSHCRKSKCTRVSSSSFESFPLSLRSSSRCQPPSLPCSRTRKTMAFHLLSFTLYEAPNTSPTLPAICRYLGQRRR